MKYMTDREIKAILEEQGYEGEPFIWHESQNIRYVLLVNETETSLLGDRPETSLATADVLEIERYSEAYVIRPAQNPAEILLRFLRDAVWE